MVKPLKEGTCKMSPKKSNSKKCPAPKMKSLTKERITNMSVEYADSRNQNSPLEMVDEFSKAYQEGANIVLN